MYNSRRNFHAKRALIELELNATLLSVKFSGKPVKQIYILTNCHRFQNKNSTSEQMVVLQNDKEEMKKLVKKLLPLFSNKIPNKYNCFKFHSKFHLVAQQSAAKPLPSSQHLTPGGVMAVYTENIQNARSIQYYL